MIGTVPLKNSFVRTVSAKNEKNIISDDDIAAPNDPWTCSNIILFTIKLLSLRFVLSCMNEFC